MYAIRSYYAAGGDDVILRRFLLQRQPLHFHIIPGVPPVAKSIDVPKIEAFLQPQPDAGERSGDLASDEGLTPKGRLVIEKNAVARIKPVRFAIVDGDPVRVKLGDGIGGPGIEGRRFLLRDFLDLAEEFRITSYNVCYTKLLRIECLKKGCFYCEKITR